MPGYLEVVVDILAAVVCAIAGAAVVQAIGASRVARWLRLPAGDYE